MENALLISLSRQMTLRRQMDVLANNMANMNTAGYKSDNIVFAEHIMPVARMDGLKGSDARLSYVQDTALFRDFASGTTKQTGNELDVALAGDGWLVVQTPDGERYTRNGQLKLDQDGQLVTLDGHAVLGSGGPLTFTPEETGIEIAKDGTISTSEGQKDTLRVVRFENNDQLKKEGSSLFSSALPAQAVEDVQVIQGAVESSNVEPISQLTRMIETVRAYTSVAQTMQGAHELRRQAIERLSGVQA